MKKTKYSILSLSILFLLSLLSVNTLNAIGEGDRINMAVSPIRDEFTANAGTSVTRQITFYNNADVPYSVYITTEDCEPGTNYGTPLCSSAGPGLDTTRSSTWITTSEPGTFTVGPNSSKIVNYTVSVPTNASPGGHYGAVFFNNPDMDISGATTVKMNRRIGMLYLMTVPGDIVVDTNFGDILIDVGPGGGTSANGPDSIMTLFSAPEEFLTKAMQGLMMVFTDPEETKRVLSEINPLWENPTLQDEGFQVTLNIPVENAGNTHISPTGKIYLYDGDERLERIGRQSIIDENGVYLGEKIVDFLPINDEGGNVLPGTDRTFSVNWIGFASDDIDPNTGKHVVQFESPASYYSRIAGGPGQFLYPWEKLAIRTMNKTLKASVEVTYKNPLTKLNEVNTFELPVPIHYMYIAKTLNWGAIILIILIILLTWMIRRRNKRIHELEDETDSLEDEISVLERAQAGISIKKKVAKAPTKSSVKKEVITKTTTSKTSKTPTKKTTPVKTETESIQKKTPIKATPVKKSTPKKVAPIKTETKSATPKTTTKKKAPTSTQSE